MPARNGPNWEPLRQGAAAGLLGAFVWVQAIDVDGGGRIHAYEHPDTRRYLHLDEDGGAWVYAGNQQYREVPLEYVLAAALATWWRSVDPTFGRRLGIES